MKYETLAIAAENGVATIIMNRPQVRNAFNEIMIAELTRAFQAADADPEAIGEILEAFFVQHYEGGFVPPVIVANAEPDSQAVRLGVALGRDALWHAGLVRDLVCREFFLSGSARRAADRVVCLKATAFVLLCGGQCGGVDVSHDAENAAFLVRMVVIVVTPGGWKVRLGHGMRQRVVAHHLLPSIRRSISRRSLRL